MDAYLPVFDVFTAMSRGHMRHCVWSALALGGFVAATPVGAQSIANGSFEDPAISNPALTVAVRAAPHWRFKEIWGWAGVTANGGPFMVWSPQTTSGTQTMFMQGAATATQSIFAMTSSQCTVTLKTVQRAGNQDPIGIRLQVEVDGAPVWAGIPTHTWSYFTTAVFALTEGAHDLTIRSLNPAGSDNTAFIDDVVTTCSWSLAPALLNGGFEAPNMFGSYAYSPSGANWTFYGAGITGNANAFTAGNPIAPNGVQTAFIQMQGYMTQSVFLNPGTYTISFKASQRGNGNSGTQLLRVLVNGVLVGSYQPPTTSYIGYETSPFVISGGGTHVLRIEGKGNGGIDFTAFVDDVQIRPVTAFRGFTDQGFINGFVSKNCG